MENEYDELSDLRDFLTEILFAHSYLTDDDSVHCESGEYFNEVQLSPSDIKWIVDQINNEVEKR